MTRTDVQRIPWRQIAEWLGPADRMAILGSFVFVFAAALTRQGWPEAWFCALLGAVAAAIFLIDLRHFRIPDRLSLPLIPLGLIYTALTNSVFPRLLAMIAVWAVLAGLQKAFATLRGQSGLGGGDIKLMTAAALWVEPQTLPLFVLAASVTALIEAFIRRANRSGRIAFGTHLAPWLVVFAVVA